mmetsp:Transcript_620/g.1583  ORF Transcript_620/g.1583 Transcript_620/m.1583 type:complete len:251 (-) Transcript_620:1194-1946(-)
MIRDGFGFGLRRRLLVDGHFAMSRDGSAMSCDALVVSAFPHTAHAGSLGVAGRRFGFRTDDGFSVLSSASASESSWSSPASPPSSSSKPASSPPSSPASSSALSSASSPASSASQPPSVFFVEAALVLGVDVRTAIGRAVTILGVAVPGIARVGIRAFVVLALDGLLLVEVMNKSASSLASSMASSPVSSPLSRPASGSPRGSSSLPKQTAPIERTSWQGSQPSRAPLPTFPRSSRRSRSRSRRRRRRRV